MTSFESFRFVFAGVVQMQLLLEGRPVLLYLGPLGVIGSSSAAQAVKVSAKRVVRGIHECEVDPLGRG